MEKQAVREATQRTDEQIKAELDKLYPKKQIKYKLDDLIFLNNGSSGVALKSHELGKEENVVVIKRMHINTYNRKERENLISLQREVENLKKCNHPLIVKYIDSFRSESGDAYLVTEYAKLGSLQDYFDKIKEWVYKPRFTEEQRKQAIY